MNQLYFTKFYHSVISNKSWQRLIIAIAFSVFTCSAYSQGDITVAATPTTNPMDPNGDGFITLSGMTFTPGLTDDQTEFEIPFVAVPQSGPEPNSDQLAGAGCGATDIIDNSNTGADASYYYYDIGPDATSNTADDKLIFRIRIA